MDEAMDEATRTLPPRPSIVIATLARQAAIKAVKLSLQAQGIKLYPFAQRDIVVMANEYAAANRAKLLAEAIERVQCWPELRELYDREQRQRQRLLERNSKDLHSARRPATQGLPLCISHVQNGGPQ